jgi:putative endonuclease
LPQPRRLGSAFEDAAAEYLAGQGYTLITRRFKTRGGEVDLIALDGEVLAFVEVRQRSHPDFSPEASVDRAKQERLFAAASRYLALYEGPEREVRFDLVAMTPQGIRLHRDAFRP